MILEQIVINLHSNNCNHYYNTYIIWNPESFYATVTVI